jgi:transcriptional regulator with XRE-family HTH domain
MGTRIRPIDEAARAWARRSLELGDELRAARRMAGVTQARIGAAVGVSGAEICRRERGRTKMRIADLVVHAAAVGLRVSLTTYPAGAGVRDEAQLRYLGRLLDRIGPGFTRQLEAPVPAPGDPRAVDAVLRAPGVVIAVEVITRLADVQAQVRAAQLKARDMGATRLILAIAGSRANRRALESARPAIASAFDLDTRRTLLALARSRQPDRDAILLL